MGMKDGLKRLMGIEDYEEVTEEEIEAEKESLAKKEKSEKKEKEAAGAKGIGDNINPYGDVTPLFSKSMSKSVSMNASGPFKMIVIEPKGFEECAKLVDNLKARKPVIINLERVEADTAHKIFDFLSGAIYALNGSTQRVTNNIFIFAPGNVDIAAKINRETLTDTYQEERSPWSK